jgi:hypothetical protein
MMKKLHIITAALAVATFSCKKDKKVEMLNDEVNKPVKEVTTEKSKTILTDENYALAESQVIFKAYLSKIAAATNTDGMGVFMHNRKAVDPKDKTVVRINFDTQYSSAILDLTEEATLTMPETNGRYQSAWFITEEHYNPMAINKPGTYKINQENTGSKYVVIVIRTQVNMSDPNDLAIASKLQDQVVLSQKDRGAYIVTNNWDMDDILEMRKKYQRIAKEKKITSGMMFGKKEDITLENHNCGTAYGFGGFTQDQAVYRTLVTKNTNPSIMVLKDVPVNAFWSVTVYDKDGFPNGDFYNVNSSFAKANSKGEYIIHFGGDKKEDNYLDIFEGWNFTLRMYQPTEAYFNGSWKMPELIEVK